MARTARYEPYMCQVALSDEECLIKNRIVNYVYMFAIDCENAAEIQIFWDRMKGLTEDLQYEHEGRFDSSYKDAVDEGIRNLKEKVEQWTRPIRMTPRVTFAWVEHLSRLLAMDMWSTLPDLSYWFDGITYCDPEAIIGPPYF